MAKSIEAENNVNSKLPNILGIGTKIVGELEIDGDIRIDGIIDGNITSKGKIVVGPNGSIKGEISCINCEVLGTVKGKMEVKELLSVKGNSKIMGNIRIGKLSVEPGAMFSVTCSMGEEIPTERASLQNEEKSKKGEK